jgi:hypothetical protein
LHGKPAILFYFEVEQNTLKKPIIGLLVADNDALINNIFYTTSIANKNTSKQKYFQ